MENKAQCACKAVSVTFSGDPEFCFACHCDYCQRLSGSVAVTAAVFRQDQMLTTQGSFSEYEPDLQNWPDCKRYFCPNCASTLFWFNPTAFPGMQLVSIGCFGDPKFKGPDTVYQTQYRHSWCGAFDAAKSFKGFS